jgi:predicted nucleic acid-binding Zn ribbon protein
MPDIKHPKCTHPKCGAKMQRIYKRDHAVFIQCGWMCMDCGMIQKDNPINSIKGMITGIRDKTSLH